MLEIFALVLGDSPGSIFSITAPEDTSISTWRESVYAKGPTLERCKPADLTIWKLNQPIPDEEVALVAGQPLSKIASIMLPSRKLSQYFPSALTDSVVHVIVVPNFPSAGEKHDRSSEVDADGEPGAKRRKERRHSGSKDVEPGNSSDSEAPPDNQKKKVQHKPRLSDPTDVLYLRSDTVEALYKKLAEHKFIFVRGTPASGKSSLAMLLRKYIGENHPEKEVHLLACYRDKPDQRPIMKYDEWLRDEGWNSPPNGVLILDEAQLSYWDNAFWLTFIKAITPSTPYMVILFASYGSASRNLLHKSTPLVVNQGQLVGLARGPTEASVGLLLTREEMEGVVKKSFPNHHFDVSLLDYIHSLTSGHVGACYDALSVVQKDQSYRGNNRGYTHADFTLNLDMSTFLKKLSDQGIFIRGLPMRDDLEDPKMPFVRNLCDVLSAPSRSVFILEEEDQRGSKHPLRLCLEQGWLFSEPADGAKVEYRSEDLIKDPDLQTFVIEVIKHFRSQNLQTRRDLSTTPQPIPEAQFQQEFYRACCLYTRGCVTTFPESGTPKGRIDFFIRSKKWGVELLRDGVKLHDHNSRFTTSEYGTWIDEGNMEDYILIDFRSKKPNRARSDNIKLLIYVVSTDNWEYLEIYNHELENIESIRLLYHNP